MNTDTHHTQWVTWVVIICVLTLGAGAYWFVTKEFTGRAAETVNVAHTEALTGSSLGLVGYWTLDGSDIKWSDTTTEIKDTSGNSKHGDAQGSLAAGSATPGQVGQGLRFNGTSDVISLGTVYNGVKTIAFWAKPNSTTQPFIDLNGTATIDVTTGTVAANNFTSPTIYVDGAVTSTFPDTNWHHIVITTGTGINASATNIGKISTSYFGGTLDDIRFYSSALSSTQVTDLYRASSAKEVGDAAHRDVLTNGLVGYWTFDGRDIKWSDTGTEVKDISGNGNHGDALGSLATTSVTPGKLGQGLSFNGTSDYITIPDNNSLDMPNGQDFTISGWFYRDTENTRDEIASKFGNDYPGYYLDLEPIASEQLTFTIRDTTGHDQYFYSRNDIPLHEWVFFTLVWDDDSDANTKFYVNGTVTDDYKVNNHSSVLDASNSYPLSIGRGDNYGTPDYYFDGKLDDIRIYKRVLSAEEILKLYTLGR